MSINYFAGKESYNDYSNRNADGSYPQVAKPTFDGLIIGETSRTVQVMSDVWDTGRFAIYVDADGSVKEYGLGVSEFGYEGSVTVDASPETFGKAFDYFYGIELDKANREFDRHVSNVVADAASVAKGKDVVVSRGRKVAKGTTGRVFWMGDNGWGVSVGIETADGNRVFTAAKNVDVVNVDDYTEDIDALINRPDYTRFAASNAAAHVMSIADVNYWKRPDSRRASWAA